MTIQIYTKEEVERIIAENEGNKELSAEIERLRTVIKEKNKALITVRDITIAWSRR